MEQCQCRILPIIPIFFFLLPLLLRSLVFHVTAICLDVIAGRLALKLLADFVNAICFY
jgi:hypothetical protein